MKTYRFTIPSRYSEDSPGHRHPDARQGHYILSDSEDNARAGLVDRFKRAGCGDIAVEEFELHRETAIDGLVEAPDKDKVCFSS